MPVTNRRLEHDGRKICIHYQVFLLARHLARQQSQFFQEEDPEELGCPGAEETEETEEEESTVTNVCMPALGFGSVLFIDCTFHAVRCDGTRREPKDWYG